MRSFGVFILLALFLALGTGALSYAHDLQHATEDAQADGIAKAAGKPISGHSHNDSNCDIHAQLHAPLLAGGWVPLLVYLGLFVAFLTLLSSGLVSRNAPARIDCRGPPAFFTSHFVLI